jgi:hypothetical protein
VLCMPPFRQARCCSEPGRRASPPICQWTSIGLCGVLYATPCALTGPGPSLIRRIGSFHLQARLGAAFFHCTFFAGRFALPPISPVSAESNERPHTFHIYQLSFSFPNILYQASAGVEPPRTESPLATRSLQRLRLVWCAAFANDRLRRRPSGGHGSMIVTMRHVHSKPNDQTTPQTR